MGAGARYEAVSFTATDRAGVPLYHTNVMMCIGARVVVIGTEAIVPADRERVLGAAARERPRDHRDRACRDREFAGNMLELGTWDEALGDSRVLVMSESRPPRAQPRSVRAALGLHRCGARRPRAHDRDGSAAGACAACSPKCFAPHDRAPRQGRAVLSPGLGGREPGHRAPAGHRHPHAGQRQCGRDQCDAHPRQKGRARGVRHRSGEGLDCDGSDRALGGAPALGRGARGQRLVRPGMRTRRHAGTRLSALVRVPGRQGYGDAPRRGARRQCLARPADDPHVARRP